MTKRDQEAAVALKVDVRRLASLFGVTKSTIGEWVHLGMPKAGPNSYLLFDCIQWRRQRDKLALDGRGDGSLTAERRRLVLEQTRGIAIENSARLAELIPRDEAAADMQAIADIISTALDRLPGDAAPGLVSQSDPAQIISILREVSRQARQRAGAAVAAYGERLAD